MTAPRTIKATVKMWLEAKGYGFVVPDGGGADIFVHQSVLRDGKIGKLYDGQRVSVEAVDDTKGRGQRAVSIKLIKES